MTRRPAAAAPVAGAALAAALLAAPPGATPATAREPLPDFATCMDRAAASFEADLRRGPRDFDIGTTRPVTFCGTQAIVRCDRGADPVACQHALAREQDALAAAIRATLPPPRPTAPASPADDPQAVQPADGAAPVWPDTLYPVLHALAHGRSAGPDCAGSTPVMAAWCDAREANRRLAAAMLAWQLARYLDAAPAATAAGWADLPPPSRPVSRPDPAARPPSGQ